MALEGTHEREHHAPNEVDIVLNLEVAEAVDDAGIAADEQMTFELVQRAQGDLDEMEEFRSRRERAALSEIRRYRGSRSNRLSAKPGDCPGSAMRERLDDGQG